MIYHGDCLDVLKTLPDNSVDSVVTDPPYGLSFMGKRWDYDVPNEKIWRECLRVLKPGGHLLSFAGTRTQHRMAVRIEDAGFEIRDMIAWVYGSGFPKSHNMSGDWQGFGTALKPALEPITVARKPLTGTVAENVQRWGCGALNIDASRIPLDGDYKCGANGRPSQTGLGDKYIPELANKHSDVGRWPANLIHDGSDEVVGLFPQSNGQQGAVGPQHGAKNSVNAYGDYGPRDQFNPRGDKGSAARFFYCAKASKRDRDEGLEGFDSVPSRRYGEQGQGSTPQQTPRTAVSQRNHHPTVKPTDLMRYLVRLVTPPGGTVLDPFAGSGSTGKACALEGFEFIGIEREAEYCAIAEARIAFAKRHEAA